MNKQDQFIEWLCGENVPFPFFKDFPTVPMPIMDKGEETQNDGYDTKGTVDQVEGVGDERQTVGQNHEKN